MRSMEPRNRRLLLTEEEKREIAAQVAKECGRLIPTDDPLFDLVVLNERVLRRTVETVGDQFSSSLAGKLDRVLSDHLDRVQEKLSADVDEKIRGIGDLYGVAVTQLERRAQLWLWAIGVSGIFAMVVASGLVRWPFW